MIVPYTVFDTKTGQILRSGRCSKEDLERQAMKAGQGVLPVESDDSKHAIEIPWDGSPPSLVDKVIVPPALEELKAAARAKAAEMRYYIENGGISLAGQPLATDDRAKLLLNSAAEQAKLNPQFTSKWKMDNGKWVAVDAATLRAAYAAVFSHVQACFAREEEIDAMIEEAKDAKELDAIDRVIADFWPKKGVNAVKGSA